MTFSLKPASFKIVHLNSQNCTLAELHPSCRSCPNPWGHPGFLSFSPRPLCPHQLDSTLPPLPSSLPSSLFSTCTCVKVVSDSVWPHGLQPARLLCPWDFPGKNTGAGCHFLLQGIFPTQGLNPRLLSLWNSRQILNHWATWEAHYLVHYMIFLI